MSYAGLDASVYSATAPTQPGPRCGPTDGPIMSTVTFEGSMPPGILGRSAGDEPVHVGAGRVQDRDTIHRADGQQLDELLAGLAVGANAFGRLHAAILDLDDRLDGEQRADRGLGAADPAAALEVLERVEAEVDLQIGTATFEGGRDLARRRTAVRHLDTDLGEHALAHRRRRRVDDVDLAVLEHGPADLGGLDRAGQRPRDVDGDDRVRAAIEGALVGLLEVARAARGGGREGRVGRGHPLPELVGGQGDAGGEGVLPEVHDERDDGDAERGGPRGVHVRRGVGDDRDAAHG